MPKGSDENYDIGVSWGVKAVRKKLEAERDAIRADIIDTLEHLGGRLTALAGQMKANPKRTPDGTSVLNDSTSQKLEALCAQLVILNRMLEETKIG
jgi:hypothetical protein